MFTFRSFAGVRARSPVTHIAVNAIGFSHNNATDAMAFIGAHTKSVYLRIICCYIISFFVPDIADTDVYSKNDVFFQSHPSQWRQTAKATSNTHKKIQYLNAVNESRTIKQRILLKGAAQKHTHTCSELKQSNANRQQNKVITKAKHQHTSTAIDRATTSQ